MRVVIIGGGISAVYLANNLRKQDTSLDIMIVSDEEYLPYDRIHLCRLVDKSKTINDISLPLDPLVKLELNQKINKIDRKSKRIFSESSMFSYDKLIVATGSTPTTLFDIKGVENAAVFRSAVDCKKIETGINNREVLVVGGGPISLELLETLNTMPSVTKVTLLLRSKHIYSKDLSKDSIEIIKDAYIKNGKIQISFDDEIVDKIILNKEIVLLKTKNLEIKNPFIIFGVGIKPNIENFKDTLKSKKGILTNTYMQSEDKDIYAVGECAEVEQLHFIAGHVKACTDQADSAISHIVQKNIKEFEPAVSIDMLKIGSFDLVEVNTSKPPKEYEKLVIDSKKDTRIDEYFLNKDRLIRFIGINSNVDVGYIETLIKNNEKVDINYLYENRLMGERGRLICSCEHVYHRDLVDIVMQTGISSFSELANFSRAGRVCGRCKVMVQDVIQESQKLIDPNIPRKTVEDIKREKEIAKVQKRIDKFNALNPKNELSADNLDAALDSLDIAKSEVNSWISMVTANMQLHPSFETVVDKSVKALNRVPIIWLELADCSGNSEAFIKSANPSIEDLILMVLI